MNALEEKLSSVTRKLAAMFTEKLVWIDLRQQAIKSIQEYDTKIEDVSRQIWTIAAQKAEIEAKIFTMKKGVFN
jgi:hypothetical protein